MITLEFETIEEFNAFIISIRGYNWSHGWTTLDASPNSSGTYKVNCNMTADSKISEVKSDE